MKKEVLAPSSGESVTEVSVLKWAKQNGDFVKSGDLLAEIETDKATLEVIAEHAGAFQMLKPVGERIAVGTPIAIIDTDVTAATTPNASPPPRAPMPPAPGSIATPAMTQPPIPPRPASMESQMPMPPGLQPGGSQPLPNLSPAARRVAEQFNLDADQVSGTGKDGRVTKGDLLQVAPPVPNMGMPTIGAMSTPPPISAPSSLSAGMPASAPRAPAATPLQPSTPPTVANVPISKAGERRVPMSMLRQKIAERLVHAQHTAAILTTFNEVDLSSVMSLRAKHKDAFKAKHGVNLSFMSFFAKAAISALKAIPEVNATIDGKDIVYHDFYDIGIAVGTERGLVVPVVRNADQLSFPEMEKKIGELAIRGRDGKLSLAELTGGTFTISNGGTYGSMLSTPILNPPQSGILGMHKIMDRPVVVQGKIEIRPMMYLALSYDHRIIDGKGAVTFLVHLKECLEQIEKLNFTY